VNVSLCVTGKERKGETVIEGNRQSSQRMGDCVIPGIRGMRVGVGNERWEWTKQENVITLSFIIMRSSGDGDLRTRNIMDPKSPGSCPSCVREKR
jgi:hypothetical protein